MGCISCLIPNAIAVRLRLLYLWKNCWVGVSSGKDGGTSRSEAQFLSKPQEMDKDGDVKDGN